MSDQEKLINSLKSKGIGPKGSKHLSSKEVQEVPNLLISTSCELTTKATFLTALLLLDKNEEEQSLVDLLITNYLEKLDPNLCFLLTGISNSKIEVLILALISRKDLTEDEANFGISYCFSKECPAYITASFLEALRLKRETDLENKCFYTYFLSHSSRTNVETTHPIIEIGDSYDGVKRNNNYNLFVACLLGSMGYPTIISGNETVAPKFGNTHHQLLKEANKNPLLNVKQVLSQFNHMSWVYLDQENFYPDLHHQFKMRKDMVKRPFIATFEKILSPITSPKGNFIVTSYTHAHYKNANVEILKNNPYCKKALNIKGLEGTVHPKHNISTVVMALENNKTVEHNYVFDTSDFKSDAAVSPKDSLSMGLDYFDSGIENQAAQYIRNTVILILTYLGLEESAQSATQRIQDCILNKEALNNWNSSHNF